MPGKSAPRHSPRSRSGDHPVPPGGSSMVCGSGRTQFICERSWQSGRGLAPLFALMGWLLAWQNADAQVFHAGIPFPTGPGPNAVAAADFNGDGKVDIATANILDADGNGTI